MISCIINPFVVYTNDEAGNASQMYAYVNIISIECLTIQILIMKDINYIVWIMYLKRNRVSGNDLIFKIVQIREKLVNEETEIF